MRAALHFIQVSIKMVDKWFSDNASKVRYCVGLKVSVFSLGEGTEIKKC